MEKQEQSRKEKMINSFKDTSEETMANWGNAFIQDNLPKTMDWLVNKIKEVASAVSKKSNRSISEQVQDVIFAGIEIGEENKERALIMAMKKVGMEESAIEEIIQDSKKYLVTRKDFENKKE